jgi:hypothetical protein
MVVRLFASVLFAAVLLVPAAQAGFIEDFEGGGTIPFTFTNSSGAPPGLLTGPPTNTFARLVNLNGNNNNSIAFDQAPLPAENTVRLALSLVFRMTDDATNAAAGGCCGSAADGLGFGIFDTAVYGTTGGVNPAVGGRIWERPNFPSAFAVGLDVFQNIDDVSLNWNGVEVANAAVAPLDLNSNVFHRADLVLMARTDGSTDVSLDIVEDVYGAATPYSIYNNFNIPGMDLLNMFDYRFIAGGRTGGAFTAGDIDNIELREYTPEPATLTLLGLATLALRRRRR